MGQINDLCKEAHTIAIEKNWYSETKHHHLPNIPELLCLIHSEISEALECYRNKRMDTMIDNRPEDPGHPTGFDIEIADAVIRIFDMCAFLGIDLESAIAFKMAYNRTRPIRHGGKIL